MDNTLYSRKLALALGHLDSEGLHLEDRDIASDNLALEVVFILDIQGILRSLLLDLAGGFDGVVFEVTVTAFERFKNNVTEEGDAKEEEFGRSL